MKWFLLVKKSGVGPSIIHLPTLLYVKANIDVMVSAELHLVRVSGADLAHHSCPWECFLICIYLQVLGKWPEWTICFCWFYSNLAEMKRRREPSVCCWNLLRYFPLFSYFLEPFEQHLSSILFWKLLLYSLGPKKRGSKRKALGGRCCWARRTTAFERKRYLLILF